jgi:hypothetical protein
MAVPSAGHAGRAGHVRRASFTRYTQFLNSTAGLQLGDALLEDMKIAPLFSYEVKNRLKDSYPEAFVQYGLLGQVQEDREPNDVNPMFLNTYTPFSIFLCGSQGSGKSHTMSCVLENCLMADKDISVSRSNLSGLVFHYDRTVGESIAQPAFLSSHIRTRVLVSPSNLGRMRKAYAKLNRGAMLTVEPLYLLPRHLNTERIKRLMAVGNGKEMPLYMHTIVKILRDMAMASSGEAQFNWTEFRAALDREDLVLGQALPLQLRLDLVESFMKRQPQSQKSQSQKAQSQKGKDKKAQSQKGKDKKAQSKKGKDKKAQSLKSEFVITEGGNDVVGQPGTLTIIDLTDPFIDPDSACVLFDISLAIFVEQTKGGKVVALDEAHNVRPPPTFPLHSESSVISTTTLS